MADSTKVLRFILDVLPHPALRYSDAHGRLRRAHPVGAVRSGRESERSVLCHGDLGDRRDAFV
ncbi:hypothetical protein GCM10009654_41490 [Streptomyces hebeiensis]|uniref:Uncharacterized protein n=1 Tax=Streptomyces hebeiensis TaxID=229486 RepID=A0ABN1UY28_9ACTN